MGQYDPDSLFGHGIRISELKQEAIISSQSRENIYKKIEELEKYRKADELEIVENTKEIAELRNLIQGNAISDLNHYEELKNKLDVWRNEANNTLNELKEHLEQHDSINGLQNTIIYPIKEVLRELIKGLKDGRKSLYFYNGLLEKLDGKKNLSKTFNPTIPDPLNCSHRSTVIKDGIEKCIFCGDTIKDSDGSEKKDVSMREVAEFCDKEVDKIEASGGENSREYCSSMEGGESIHIASPNDSKPPEPKCKCDSCWKKGNYEVFMCPTIEKCITTRDYSPKGPKPRKNDSIKNITMSVIKEFNKGLLGEGMDFLMIKRVDLQRLIELIEGYTGYEPEIEEIKRIKEEYGIE